MSAHTPGPWTVDPRPDDIFAIRGNNEHYYVARCSRGGLQEKHKRSLAAAQANAALIAAAPDMLAALKDILGLAEAHASRKRDTVAQASVDASIAKARAVIAKAEGTS